MDMTYQTSPAWASTRAAYGDDDEDHENVRGILHLYAKWILDPDSSGYNVVYDAGDAAIRDDLGNLLTTVPVDTSMYAFSDNATAITREAPSNYNDLYQFSYWEATLLNGTKIQLQPGDSIPLTEIAAVEIMYDESTGEVVRKTIKLTAIYTTTAGDRITHITYNGNTFTENWYDGTTHEVHGRTMDGTDRLEVTLNKEVNESIELPGAEYFYLEGYEMVGWSFQEGSEQTKHFDLGQVVAADNLDQDELNTEENTLYVMWFPRTYTAKIKQVIESGVPVNSFTYNFKTGEENGIGSIPAASVTLTGNSSFTASENLHYYNLSGDVISVDLTPHIPEDAAYDVRVNAVVTKDDGTREILQPTADGVYRIYGDVEITYTYSMKVLVRLQKRDALDHSIVLTDSVFVMTPVEFNSSTQHYEIAGSGKTVSINEAIVQRYLQEGIYKLTETTVPNGYASIGKDLYLEIYQDEAQSFRLFDEGGNTISANIAELDGTGRILTIYDRPVRTVTVTKQVTGGFGDQNKYFRFAITSAEDNESISGEGLTRQNDGSWGFSLKHGQSISITVLKGDTVTVTEVSDADSGRYTTTWNNGTTVSKVSTFDVNEDMYATVYNYLPPVAPTGTYVATQPYIILLLAGALLLILSLGVRRRAKVGDAYE